MARRHHHYERAIERFLRFHRVPYVSVNEARKTLIPRTLGRDDSLKSFDFVLYGRPNLLAEIKGRRVPSSGRLDPWATRRDVDDLLAWESLFGPGFRACFVFAFWCDALPRTPRAGVSPDFDDIFEHDRRWYALRTISATDYAAHMRTRSTRWETVHIPITLFNRLSRDLLDPHQSDAPLSRLREPTPPARGTFLHRFGVPQACG